MKKKLDNLGTISTKNREKRIILKEKNKLEKILINSDIEPDHFIITKDIKKKFPPENSRISSFNYEGSNNYNIDQSDIISHISLRESINNREKNNTEVENKLNKEIFNNLFPINNVNIEDKEIMVSELDIELTNNSKNKKNTLTNHKTEANKITITKKDLKKQIEQCLEKFMISNQGNKKDKQFNKEIKDNSLKPGVKNTYGNIINKKSSTFVKVNHLKPLKKNGHKTNEFKNSIFYLENKKKKKNMFKQNNKNHYTISNRSSNFTNNQLKEKDINLSKLVKKRVIENHITNTKNIIIQNFNCIDYININNNIINTKKLNPRKSYKIKNNYAILNDKLFKKKDDINKIAFLSNKHRKYHPEIKSNVFNDITYNKNIKAINLRLNIKNKPKKKTKELNLKEDNFERKTYFNTITTNNVFTVNKNINEKNRISRYVKLLLGKKKD